MFVSEALNGETVAIREREDGHHLVRFCDVPLLLIDRKTGKAARFGPGRPPRTKTGKKHSQQSVRDVIGLTVRYVSGCARRESRSVAGYVMIVPAVTPPPHFVWSPSPSKLGEE